MAPSKKGKAKKGDGRFFATTKKGEVHELTVELNSGQPPRVKDAVKKVIAAMTVGKDMSGVFTSVIKSIATQDIELKKLVYLYIINYARTQPDKAILVVNTFQKDASDLSPLVRALAIRTMGCIRVDRITEYLCEPLHQALKDKDPYVRKTAAVCVAKLYDINADLVEEQDFLDQLRDMISDPNPMVVANAVAALAEISESSGKDVFLISSATIQKLLAALHECTEWGQVFLLDALSKYEPSASEAETIIERVIPRLQHANSAVAMSAIKVIMKYLDVVRNEDLVTLVVRQKLPPPLITLLSEHKPEIQYVTLRNVNLIVQKRPEVLAREVKHFFCKYNDPIYVKMEKLEILIKLVSNENVEQVLLEFKEYASEVDVEFVRRAVSAIGRCAIKLERAAERCIKVLLELIQTKVNYVVQQAVIVIRDVFRKYPNRYESIIATLCENLDTLDEPDAKASMVWIIGEYAARIENAPELLETFVESFMDEAAVVQLQILTATVKLFLRRPEDAKDMVTQVLNMATENSDNPDLRDRGYVYWRLLATDPEAAQAVVLADKPVINDDAHKLEPELLDQLVANISTLASVYHKPPEAFVAGGKTFVFRNAGDGGGSDDDDDSSDDDSSDEEESDSDESDSDESGSDDDAPKKAAASAPAAGVVDILGGLEDLGMGMPSFDAAAPAAGPVRKIVLPAAKGQGLQISSAFVRRGGNVFMDMLLQNQSRGPLRNFALKFNKNTFNVQPAGPLRVAAPIAPGGQAEVSLPINATGAQQPDASAKYGVIQIAIKSDLGVAYFQDELAASVLFTEDGDLGKGPFLEQWKSLSDEDAADVATQGLSADAVKARLTANNLFDIATRSVPGKGEVLYMSARLGGNALLAEVTVAPGGSSVRVCTKAATPILRQAARDAIVKLLQ